MNDESNPPFPPRTPPTSPDAIPPLPPPAREPRSALAVASILCALASFCFPPAGVAAVIFGILAVRKGTHGLAIAGIVIGLVGGCASAAFVLPAIFLPTLARVRVAARTVQTNTATRSIENDVATFVRDNGRPPKDMGELYADDPAAIPLDMWGTTCELRTEPSRETGGESASVVFIWSAGPDAAWGTDDDFVNGSWPKVDPTKYGHPDPTR